MGRYRSEHPGRYCFDRCDDVAEHSREINPASSGDEFEATVRGSLFARRLTIKVQSRSG